MIVMGNIDGLLLTGLTPMGVQLFEQYVDRTGDIQTASLVMSLVSPKQFSDSRIDDWVESYRYLLDRWQLHHIRAKFDIARRRYSNIDLISGSPNENSPSTSPLIPPQFYVRCNFCNQSITHHSIPTMSSSSSSSSSLSISKATSSSSTTTTNTPSVATGTVGGSMIIGTNKVKITCCPHCRKSLPKCALCLLPLGTPAQNMEYFSKKSEEAVNMKPISKNETTSNFDLWFTWCQTCRHGGHAVHILDWFNSGRSECPVSDCKCRCQQ